LSGASLMPQKIWRLWAVRAPADNYRQPLCI
jgi:hypothetical protein